MRRGDGSTRDEDITNWNLLGLDALLEQLPFLAEDQRRERAGLLWKSLTELVNRIRHECFLGTYKYHYYAWYSRTFSSQFVRRLNEAPWIPTEDGDLRLPGSVSFLPWVGRQMTFFFLRLSSCNPVRSLLLVWLSKPGSNLKFLTLLGNTRLHQRDFGNGWHLVGVLPQMSSLYTMSGLTQVSLRTLSPSTFMVSRPLRHLQLTTIWLCYHQEGRRPHNRPGNSQTEQAMWAGRKATN